MIAVPLQTNDRVIGLIYVDSPDLIREFTREDLGLLTVMANVAAIRIEHARLSEIEAGSAPCEGTASRPRTSRWGFCSLPTADGHGYRRADVALPHRRRRLLRLPRISRRAVRVLVGDVAGKGMPASLLMSSLQARVQSALRRRRPPGRENHAAQQGNHRATAPTTASSRSS